MEHSTPEEPFYSNASFGWCGREADTRGENELLQEEILLLEEKKSRWIDEKAHNNRFLTSRIN